MSMDLTPNSCAFPMKKKRESTSLVIHGASHNLRVARSSTSWAVLPFPVLLQVLLYLNDEDRISSAKVCRHWKNVFDTPFLWRKQMFEFGGTKGKPLGQRAIQYAASHGAHLTHLTLVCQHVTSSTCVIICNTLIPFLDALREARLSVFHLVGLEQERFWKHSYLKMAIAENLTGFYQSQRNLKIVQMSCGQFAMQPGLDVLDAMAQASGSRIEKLIIDDFFDGRRAIIQYPRYRTIIDLFSNLTHVALNYSCLGDDVIKAWTTRLKGRLKQICLRVNDDEPYGHVISVDTWSSLKKACPALTVSMSINGIGRSSDVIPILVTSIPLTHLYLWSGYDREIELHLSSILQHVTSCYHQRLEEVHLEFDNYHDDVDEDLVAMVIRCRSLKAIRVKANITIEVATTICNLVRDGRIPATSINITLCDVTDHDIEELHMLRERMQPTVEDRCIELVLQDNLF